MTGDSVWAPDGEWIGLGKIGGGRDMSSTDPASSLPIDLSAEEVKPMTAAHQLRRPRPLDVIREGDGDPRHGKLSTYNNHSCRCPECTRAMREYARDLKARRRRALDGE